MCGRVRNKVAQSKKDVCLWCHCVYGREVWESGVQDMDGDAGENSVCSSRQIFEPEIQHLN